MFSCKTSLAKVKEIIELARKRGKFLHGVHLRPECVSQEGIITRHNSGVFVSGG